jgi:hypothetical protein
MQPIRDHFETYVVTGIGERPKCPLPESSYPVRIVKVGEIMQVWLRSVSKDDLLEPQSSVAIVLDAVDPWGDTAVGVEITPANIVTAGDGFNSERIVVKATEPIGGFFIRARYADRHVTGSSLSRLLTVEFH